jgi:lipoprotein-releasing system permease protein
MFGLPLGVIVICALAALITLGLLVRGIRSTRRSTESSGIQRRSLSAYFGVVAGVLFIVLTLAISIVTARAAALGTVHCGSQPFILWQEIVRFGALGSGVVFLLFTLAAILPLCLDFLERRGFVPFVGARHFRATKSGFLTAISVLSIMGVGFSSCALCSVTSIMGGFGADLKQKILGNGAHLVVEPPTPVGLDDWPSKLDAVRVAIAPFGGAATPVVAGDAMGSSNSNTAGVLLRGIDPESIGNVIDLKKNLEVGKFEYLTDPEKIVKLRSDEVIGCSAGGAPFFRGEDLHDLGGPRDVDDGISEFLRARYAVRPGIILGKELAKSLHVYVGSEVTLLSPMGELGPMGVMPKTRRYRVAAIFYSGMYEYDASHAYVLMQDAQDLLGMEQKVTSIDVHVPEPEKIDDVRAPVEAAIAKSKLIGEGEIRVKDWKEMNKNLFSALKLERLATFVILCIAIAVASFCIVCTLLLMVTEKTRQIAVLKAMGANNAQIARIFVLEGVIIGAIGTTFGVATAFAACTGLAWFGVRLDPEVYYINRLPVNVDTIDYLTVALASMVICSTATIIPSMFAASQQPLDGIRHE